jgi:hypothetical protein
MSDQEPTAAEQHDAEGAVDREPDEVEEVLAALRLLWQKTTNPVIRACLEDARSDIAYLVAGGGRGATPEEFEEDDPDGDLEGDHAA